jgi:hypothetical protein
MSLIGRRDTLACHRTATMVRVRIARRAILAAMVVAVIAGCSHNNTDRSGEPPLQPVLPPDACASAIPAANFKESKATTMTEEQAIGAARDAAQLQGYATQGFDVAAKRANGCWEVSFFKLEAGSVGGPGFVVRLEASSGKLVDILSFQ